MITGIDNVLSLWDVEMNWLIFLLKDNIKEIFME